MTCRKLKLQAPYFRLVWVIRDPSSVAALNQALNCRPPLFSALADQHSFLGATVPGHVWTASMTERSPSPLPPTLSPTKVHLPSRSSPDTLKVFQDAILLTEGRDKVVKLLQYTSRLIVLLSSSPSKRLRPFISQMSMTRKVLKLGHGVFPYSELTGGVKGIVLLRAIVEIVNDFWDDVYCLSRIGLLKSKRMEGWSEIWANRAWMMGIIMDLQVLLQRNSAMAAKMKVEREKYLKVGEIKDGRGKLRVEAFWIDVSILKLLMDFGFCCISLERGV
jgi:hypothetical protein